MCDTRAPAIHTSIGSLHSNRINLKGMHPSIGDNHPLPKAVKFRGIIDPIKALLQISSSVIYCCGIGVKMSQANSEVVSLNPSVQRSSTELSNVWIPKTTFSEDDKVISIANIIYIAYLFFWL